MLSGGRSRAAEGSNRHRTKSFQCPPLGPPLPAAAAAAPGAPPDLPGRARSPIAASLPGAALVNRSGVATDVSMFLGVGLRPRDDERLRRSSSGDFDLSEATTGQKAATMLNACRWVGAAQLRGTGIPEPGRGSRVFADSHPQAYGNVSGTRGVRMQSWHGLCRCLPGPRPTSRSQVPFLRLGHAAL